MSKGSFNNSVSEQKKELTKPVDPNRPVYAPQELFDRYARYLSKNYKSFSGRMREHMAADLETFENKS